MELLPALILFAVVAIGTPGPNNMMIMASGLNFGVRRSIPHYLGICIGFSTMVLVIGLGLGFIFQQYPFAHLAIKVMGAAYLLYLAWLIANAAEDGKSHRRAHPLTFFQAALFQWLNPKAWSIGTGAIAVYTSGTSVYGQVVVIAVVYLFTTALLTGLWMLLGVGMRKLISTNIRRRLFNRVMGALLAISVMPVVLNL